MQSGLVLEFSESAKLRVSYTYLRCYKYLMALLTAYHSEQYTSLQFQWYKKIAAVSVNNSKSKTYSHIPYKKTKIKKSKCLGLCSNSMNHKTLLQQTVVVFNGKSNSQYLYGKRFLYLPSSVWWRHIDIRIHPLRLIKLGGVKEMIHWIVGEAEGNRYASITGN